MVRGTAIALIAGAIIALNACDGGDNGGVQHNPNDSKVPVLTDAAAWEIGPVTPDHGNYSSGVPLHPTQLDSDTWAFDFPQAPGSVHYVTARYGSLAGKSRIVLKYRVEADPDVHLYGANCPVGSPTGVTLYFQRAGDNWSGSGKYEAYRWWATFATQSPLLPGDYQLVAPLDGEWTAVETSKRSTNPTGFAAALTYADRVGFTFLNCTGFGHGAYATGPAKFIVTGFSVE